MCDRSADARTDDRKVSARPAASPNAIDRDSGPSKTAMLIVRPEPSRCRHLYVREVSRLSRSTASQSLPGGLHRRDLLGRQDGERHAEIDQRLQRRRIAPGLRQPQPLGGMAEAAAKVLQPPQELCLPIARAQQRHDRVRVGLRHRAAVAQASPLIGVGRAQPLMRVAVVPLDPARQRGAEVVRHAGVVVDDGLDAALGVVNARPGVGAVALRVDARVPVVQRRRRRFPFQLVGPRVLARWLIEVPVDDQSDGKRRHSAVSQKFRDRVSKVSRAFWTTVTPPSLTVWRSESRARSWPM